MPYEVKKNDSGQFCVHKQGEMEPMACHDTEEEAMSQMQALYANEGAKAVKFAEGNDEVIEGIGAPYGGVHNGQDLAGEHFSGKTDFCFEWFNERPLLYQHGLDANTGTSVVGRVKSWKKTDVGIWVQAQLDASSEYFDAIKELVRKGKLFFSSGAMSHLVETNKKTGEIKRWPWVELSLTPTPCNLLATLDFATAKSHFKAIDIDIDEDELRAKLDTEVTIESSNIDAEPKKDAGELLQLIIDDDTDLAMALEAMPIANHAEAVKILATSLLERTKDLRERRVKEGRQMSAANRKRMKEAMDAMRQTMDEMMAFIDSTEPTPAKAVGVRAQLEMLKFYAATLN